MNTIKLDTTGTNVKMIAHRGLSGLERENTCAAFVAAGNREKYFGIETDIHRTLDGKFVIFHDDNTKRVAVDSMVIEETTFDTLRSLRLAERDGTKSRGDLIMPTLEEYLRICKYYGKIAVLELKREYAPENIPALVEAIRQSGWLEHTVFISFYLNNLIRLRKRYPKVKAQFLLSTWDDKHLESLEKYDLGLDIKHTAITAEICQKVHALGKEVNVWTVDTVEDGRRVMECGVDYITSNILE